MQDLMSVEWFILASLCIASAAVAVWFLNPKTERKGMEQDLLLADGRTDAVFLFDDQTLIAWSSGARKFLGENADDFSWTKLRDNLSRSYPGLPQSPGFLRDVGSLTLSGTAEADSREAHCEWIDGVTRVQLRRTSTELGQAGDDQELTTLRAAVHQAPYPVWLQSDDARVTWTNLAYDRLNQKIRGRGNDTSAPLFPNLDAPMNSGRPERVSIELPETDKKLWYNVSTTETEAGWLCHAMDVNAVTEGGVDAALDGADVVQGVIDAAALAQVDPYRAATHNKGIMNGIDAVVLATGNDWRAIEAGAHAYAARNGGYTSLSHWEKSENGALIGTLELPLALGLVGGATKTHPAAQAAIRMMRVKTARELAEITAAVGLAQNLGALRALATEGIQKGHMTLHARNIAILAGAEGSEVETVSAAIVTAGKVNVDCARVELADLRAKPTD